MNRQVVNSMTVAVTGGNGYFGSCLIRYLRGLGVTVLSFTRSKEGGSASVNFRLGESVHISDLQGVDALIHCAHDFLLKDEANYHDTNYNGSKLLFQAAKAAGVKKIIYISSLAAFDGCKSLYGRTKLACEGLALEYSALVLRPGLIYGEGPNGIFASIARQASGSSIVPLIGDGKQVTYLVHELDLCEIIYRLLKDESYGFHVDVPIMVANSEPFLFVDLLKKLAAKQGRSPLLIPTPWRLIWGVLKACEGFGVPVKFRSDSVISFVNFNKNVDVSLINKHFTLRPVKFDL